MLSLYDLLLRLYPASFRHEYGGEMRAVFQRERQRSSGLGLVVLWLVTIADICANAGAVHLDILRQDVSYTARVLRKSPGFTLTAVVIVALGIGATTAAFSVTDFVLIRPLAFPESDRLVKIWEVTPGYSRMELSPPNYRDWKAGARSFDSVGAYFGYGLTMTGVGEPRRLVGAGVSGDLFSTLRAAPLMGRIFTDADDRPGAAARVVISYRLWQNDFGGDPNVVGRSVNFDGEPYTVIGVMPSTFHFPSSDEQFWVTQRFDESQYQAAERTNNLLEAVGRLRPGVTVAQARAELEGLAARSRLQFPNENLDTAATAIPLREEVSQRSRLLLMALSGASVCVLLVACANLANLLLTRALARRRELALRTAIGAGRQRLVRQLMTESILLAGIGGALGIAVAVAAVPLLSQLVPTSLPLAVAPSVDWRVLSFAVSLTVLTGLGFGLAPVLRAGRGPDLEGLRERSGGDSRGERLRSLLVVTEIAGSLVLLVSVGLLLRALITVRDINPGFTPEGVLTMRTELPMPRYATVVAREAFYGRVLEQVRSLPGVTGAGYISHLPISSFRGGIWPVVVPGEADANGQSRSENHVASLRYVTPGYLGAMRIPLRQGRDIDAGDTASRPFVAVVSESFARRYWPNQDPIGRHFTFAFADRQVVGVVGDVRFRGLERIAEPQVYLSSQQVPDGAITFYAPKALAVRASAAPERLIPSIRDIIRQADPTIPLSEVQTLSDMVDQETATRSVQLRMLGTFALIAFGLAGIGIHGLLSFSVARRTQEIGVRIALGARPGTVVSLVVRQCLVLALVGVVLGIAGAYSVGRSLQALLAGVQPTDLPTLSAAVVLSLVMTVVGGLLPTLRALRIDPVAAIRAE